MGLSSAPSGTGIQLLSLANNTLGTPYPAVISVSKGIQTDPCRSIILSPSEGGVFDVFNTSSTSITEFANAVAAGSPQFDSAAQDCTTGIAMATIEGTSTALHHGFDPGDVYARFSSRDVDCAGTGSVFPGVRRLRPTGQMGSPLFPVLTWRLLQVKVAGTSLVLCCFHPRPGAASLPWWITLLPHCQALPDGHVFEQGTEPHTIAGYASPTNSKAYGLMANGFSIPSTYLAVIDLQALLSAPRTAGTAYGRSQLRSSRQRRCEVRFNALDVARLKTKNTKGALDWAPFVFTFFIALPDFSVPIPRAYPRGSRGWRLGAACTSGPGRFSLRRCREFHRHR